MSNKNNELNSDRRQSIKTPHMFQKNNQESIIIGHDIDLLPQHQENLSKIVRRYRSKNDQNIEINTNSLVENLKHFLEIKPTDEIKTLYDYIEDMKKRYINKIESNEEDNSEELEEVEEKVDQEEIEKTEIKEEPFNISDLIKTSEQEILNSKDQKSLLQSLIQDINQNSSNKAQYDDSQLERNMNKMMNDDIIEEETKDIIENKKEEYKDLEVKKSHSKWIWIIIILILLGIAGYVYKDFILDFIQQQLKSMNI